MGVFGINEAGAKSNGKGRGACYDTYLVDNPAGESEGIWTLSQDGTVQVTDSVQELFCFSHQQGVWRHKTGREAKATFINFTFNPNGSEPAGYECNLSYRFGISAIFPISYAGEVEMGSLVKVGSWCVFTLFGPSDNAWGSSNSLSSFTVISSGGTPVTMAHSSASCCLRA